MHLSRVEHRELLRALRFEEAIPDELQDRAKKHIAECPECQHALRDAVQLKKKMRPTLNAAHPSAEALLAYLTAADSALPSEAQIEAAGQNLQRVHTHVQKCAFCQGRLKHLQGEVSQIQHIMQDAKKELAFERDYRVSPSVSSPVPVPQKRKFVLPPIPKAIAPIVGASAALLLISFLSLATRPDTYLLANLNTDKLDVFPINRGNAPDELTLLAAEIAINAGNYRDARQDLAKLDPSKLSAEQTLRFRLCDLMLRLKDAHRAYVIFFPYFETPQVRAALKPMEEILASFETANSNNEDHLGLAHYYCAKANLMLEDKNAALMHLEKSLRTRHQRRPAAEKLLQALTRR